MRVPLLRRNSRLTAVIPALSGGVDRRRAPWLIADNALADGENVWWKDGALRAREGFYTTAYRKQTVEGGQYHFFIDRDGWTVSAEISDNGTAAQASLRAVDKNGEHGRILHQLSLPSGGSVCAVPSGGSLDRYTVLSFLNFASFVFSNFLFRFSYLGFLIIDFLISDFSFSPVCSVFYFYLSAFYIICFDYSILAIYFSSAVSVSNPSISGSLKTTSIAHTGTLGFWSSSFKNAKIVSNGGINSG